MLYIILWVTLGCGIAFATPTNTVRGWATVSIVPILFGFLLMAYEVVKGKIMVPRIRRELASHRELAPDTELLEAAVFQVCLQRQLIYHIDLPRFILGLLVVAVPMLLAGVAVYSVRCWLL